MHRTSKQQVATGKKKAYGKVKGPYKQATVSKRIEALFLDNLGRVVTREMIIQAATDPVTGQPTGELASAAFGAAH